MTFPGLWGFMAWDAFHWMSEMMVVYPSLLPKWRLFVSSLIATLPCIACKYHAVIHITTHSLSDVKSGQQAVNYAFQFHNSVNAKLGKPQWKSGTYKQKYLAYRKRNSEVSARALCRYLFMIAQSLPNRLDLNSTLIDVIHKGWDAILSTFEKQYLSNRKVLPRPSTETRNELCNYVLRLRVSLKIDREVQPLEEYQRLFTNMYFTTEKLKITMRHLEYMQSSSAKQYLHMY